MQLRIWNKKYNIAHLISDYPFHDYRLYRILKKNKLDNYLLNQILDLSKDNKIVLALQGNKILGLASLIYLAWDSKIFGFKMAKIGHLITKEQEYYAERSIKDALLGNILKLCKTEKIVHLSCRVDSSDISSLGIIEQNGFKLTDTIVTYVFNKHKHDIDYIKDIYKVRKFKKEDLPHLIRIAKHAFLKDRFHLDPHIPNEKADNLFGGWVKNSCCRLNRNRVFVAQKQKEIAGFLTFKLNRELDGFLDYKICGHGLSAVSVEAKGAYPALVKAAIEDVSLNFDCLEFDTQISNYEVIKIWQWFGFDFIRSKYTFHKWLKA